MKRKDLIRYLHRHACELVREEKRHSWWGNPAQNLRSAVLRHAEIGDNLANNYARIWGYHQCVEGFAAIDAVTLSLRRRPGVTGL